MRRAWTPLMYGAKIAATNGWRMPGTKPSSAAVRCARAASTSGRCTATGIWSTWFCCSPVGSPGSTLVVKPQLALPVSSVTSSVLGTFAVISGFPGARSGPHVSGTFFAWKSASGTFATLAQSARTAGQSGRSPALTDAM